MEDHENSIYALKTATGQERNVARSLARKSKDIGMAIGSILVLESLKSYILVESSNRIDIQNPALKIPNLKRIVGSKSRNSEDYNSIPFEEVKKFLNPKPIISSIQKGSIVELISGPFKEERAKVVRIDESREEVVIELIEAAVPIPVTVKGDQIRIIKKEGK